MEVLEYTGLQISSDNFKGLPLIDAIYKCSEQYENKDILICNNGTDTKAFLEKLEAYKHLPLIASNTNILHPDIGYVEDSPFIKINTEVVYPSWMKGTQIVYISSGIVNTFGHLIERQRGFLYWINALGKITMSQGVFNYQIPGEFYQNRLKTNDLYCFVKQHYKKRWVFLLFLAHIIYEKRFPILALLKAQFYPKVKQNITYNPQLQYEDFNPDSTFSYDVVIPTIGRKNYLVDALHDFEAQKYKPKRIIIVEQNADLESVSELTNIIENEWSFEIIHHFTHVSGACNARNIAVKNVKSEWVFFFDDDGRLPLSFSETVVKSITLYLSYAYTFSYLQKGEEEPNQNVIQWYNFGSGCSLVAKNVVDQCKYDLAFEHGYGEDTDYGMQIRNLGYDIVYIPYNTIQHLKAPVGGFRKKHKFPWDNDKVKPKPSPQVMYYRLKHTTLKQLRSYKMVLFLKFYWDNTIKNPVKYFVYFKKAWRNSLYWAEKISNR